MLSYSATLEQLIHREYELKDAKTLLLWNLCMTTCQSERRELPSLCIALRLLVVYQYFAAARTDTECTPVLSSHPVRPPIEIYCLSSLE